MAQEPDPIPPAQARDILEAAIRQRLGDDWDDEDNGWTKVTGHDYMARLTRGQVSLDFYVDLLGNVTVEQTTSAPTLETGRLLLFIMIGLSLVIAFLIVRIVSGG
ncbi:MAG: hypothetical protein R3E39_29555 [Anaerolineae bacterium]